MPPHFDFQYRFHAAGQGIFASGTVTATDRTKFHWVFDCGSTNLSRVLRPKIKRYRTSVAGDTLDLLCISHFHNDHVSGLGDLLKKLKVNTIVMPYLSPLERLVLGCINGRGRKGYLSFLADPVVFVLEQAEAIGQIVFVSSLGDTERNRLSPQPLNPSWQDDQRSRSTFDFDPKLEAFPDDLVDSNTRAAAVERGTSINLSLGSFKNSVRVGLAEWEFMFFHKPISADAITKLRSEVESVLGMGSLPISEANIQSALASKAARKGIKAVYEKVVSSLKGESVNSTSLCVYSGPTNNVPRAVVTPWIVQPDVEVCVDGGGWVEGAINEKPAILYTGDADFLSPPNRKALQKFLSPGRCKRVGIFQVPHHGSAKNWEIGKVAEFNQSHSVFCASGTNSHYGHPDASVWNDLSLKGAVLVDASQGCRCNGKAFVT